MAGVPGEPSFEGTLSDDGTAITGTFTQGGSSLDFELRRVDTAGRARAALEGFDELVEKAVADFNVPGLAVAVVAGGEVVYARGFGRRDVENDLPMTPDTLFRHRLDDQGDDRHRPRPARRRGQARLGRAPARGPAALRRRRSDDLGPPDAARPGDSIAPVCRATISSGTTTTRAAARRWWRVSPTSSSPPTCASVSNTTT